MRTVLLPIGDFARLGGVSVRMLRHYDRIGLLTPARVDAQTGHRAYETGQLSTLNRIVALKGLGFTLQQVADLLREGLTPGELHGMLRLRQVELERQVQHSRHALDRVAARLRLLEQETDMDDAIRIKHIPTLRLAGLSAITPEPDRASVGPRIEPLFTRVADVMDRTGGDRTSPLARYIPADGTAVQITAGYVVMGEPPPELERHDLPAAEVAAALHQGPMQDIAGAYQALSRWAGAHGHHHSLAAGCWRELYLEAGGDDQREWIVEVQLELG